MLQLRMFPKDFQRAADPHRVGQAAVQAAEAPLAERPDDARIARLLAIETAAGTAVIDELRRSRDAMEREGASLNEAFARLIKNVRAQASEIAGVLEAAGTVEIDGAAVPYASLVAETGEEVGRLIQRTQSCIQHAHALMQMVARVTEAAARIGGSIELVEQVTSRSRILSLNAMIEAARAGEHGRGFSVVAAEVRDLAATVADLAKRMRADVTAVGAEMEAGRDDLAAMSSLDEAELTALGRQVTGSLQALAARGTGLESWLQRAQSGTEAVSADVAAIMTGVQFEDRICQELDVGIRLLEILSAARGEAMHALPVAEATPEPVAQQLLDACVMAVVRERVARHLAPWLQPQARPSGGASSTTAPDIELF